MHEMALTQSILDIACAEADKHNAQRVLAIRIRIGEFSGVVPAYLQEYFNIVSCGTLAEGARLEIETVPVVIHCKQCDQTSRVSRHNICCPLCGSSNISLQSGREYYVESLEVE